jgi:L-rhamnose-H+ transport protein
VEYCFTPWAAWLPETSTSLLVVILLGGSTTNCIWCVWLGRKNRIFADYGRACDGGSLGVNYLLCMTDGVLWYL